VVRQRTETRTLAGEAITLVAILLDNGPWVLARANGIQLGERVSLRITGDGAIEAVGETETFEPSCARGGR
jgi:hypothetical protein